MAEEWTTTYAGHSIRVVNASRRESLAIDGEVVDRREGFWATQSLLPGKACQSRAARRVSRTLDGA